MDAVAAVEGEGAAEEADGGRGFLVGEHLGVGEAAVVVDGDVDVLPADVPRSLAVAVGVAWRCSAACVADATRLPAPP